MQKKLPACRMNICLQGVLHIKSYIKLHIKLHIKPYVQPEGSPSRITVKQRCNQCCHL
jgi:hypothetical protein